MSREGRRGRGGEERTKKGKLMKHEIMSKGNVDDEGAGETLHYL